MTKNGIFHAFDIETFFDEEGLLDKLYTLYTKEK